jgi:hypothetical protein
MDCFENNEKKTKKSNQFEKYTYLCCVNSGGKLSKIGKNNSLSTRYY